MANVTRFDPFNDLDELFKGFLVRPLAFEARGDGGGVQLPRAKEDVAEKNGAYVVSAELPGVKKEDIHVSIDGNVIGSVSTNAQGNGLLHINSSLNNADKLLNLLPTIGANASASVGVSGQTPILTGAPAGVVRTTIFAISSGFRAWPLTSVNESS